MNAAIDQLISILNEEAGCYGEMKAVLQDEARAIPLSNRQELDQTRSRKEALVARITRLERKRESSVQRLASAYQIDASQVKVSELAAYLPDPDAGKLKSCAAGLRLLMEEVLKKNGANRKLVRYYMKWIDNAMHLLTGLFDDNPVYRKPGSQSENSGYRSNSGNIIRSSI